MVTLRKRHAQKIGFTVDLLGEGVVSEAQADEYAARYLDLLEKLARETKNWADPLGNQAASLTGGTASCLPVVKLEASLPPAGSQPAEANLFPVVNLSAKVSALYSQ